MFLAKLGRSYSYLLVNHGHGSRGYSGVSGCAASIGSSFRYVRWVWVISVICVKVRDPDGTKMLNKVRVEK